MRKEQKIKKVLDSAKTHPTSKIDIVGKGSAVNHLKKKGIIGKDKLDYCYERSLFLDLEDKVMEQEEIIKELQDRLKKAENQGGRNWKGLCKITDKCEQIEKNQNEIKAQLKAQRERMEQAQQKEQQQAQQFYTQLGELQAQLESLKAQQNYTQQQAQQPRETQMAENEQAQQAQQEQQSDIVVKRILDWSIVRKPSTVRGKKYLFWYANKFINGKQEWIYVGKDPNKASEKITKWLAKRQDAQQEQG